MNTQTQLDQALEALRHEHRSIQPPPDLANAMAARRTAPNAKAIGLWTITLASAAAIAIAIVLFYPHLSPLILETHTNPAPVPSPASIQPNVTAASLSPAQLRAHRPRPRVRRADTAPSPFIPLPAGEGLPTPSQATLVRTRIDVSSLWRYGLTSLPPTASGTIRAEFIVGEDGLPRAIRLVP
jgi:hypothetical protein